MGFARAGTHNRLVSLLQRVESNHRFTSPWSFFFLGGGGTSVLVRAHHRRHFLFCDTGGLDLGIHRRRFFEPVLLCLCFMCLACVMRCLGFRTKRIVEWRWLLSLSCWWICLMCLVFSAFMWIVCSDCVFCLLVIVRYVCVSWLCLNLVLIVWIVMLVSLQLLIVCVYMQLFDIMWSVYIYIYIYI